MKPRIKFGDVLIFSEEWYKYSDTEPLPKPVKFLATGKIKEEPVGHYILYVVKENSSYIQHYYHGFLKQVS